MTRLYFAAISLVPMHLIEYRISQGSRFDLSNNRDSPMRLASTDRKNLMRLHRSVASARSPTVRPSKTATIPTEMIIHGTETWQ